MNGLILMVSLWACGGETPPPPAPTVAVAPGHRRDVEVSALHDAGKVRVLDVRTRGETLTGMVPNAVNIPIDDLQARMAELGPPTDEEIYVICKSGGRSAAASQMLVANGYNVVNVKGGMMAWLDAGYPTD